MNAVTATDSDLLRIDTFTVGKRDYPEFME